MENRHDKPMQLIKDIELNLWTIQGNPESVVNGFEKYLRNNLDVVTFNATPKYGKMFYSVIVFARDDEKLQKLELDIKQMLKDLIDVENTFTAFQYEHETEVYIPLDDCIVVASVSRETFNYNIIRIEKKCKSIVKSLNAKRFHYKYYSKIRDVAYLIHLLSQ